MWYLELRLFWLHFPPFCVSSNIKTAAYALVDDNLVAFYFHNYVLNSMITSCRGGWCSEYEALGTGSVTDLDCTKHPLLDDLQDHPSLDGTNNHPNVDNFIHFQFSFRHVL